LFVALAEAADLGAGAEGNIAAVESYQFGDPKPAARRLSSMDLLDEGEHAWLDGWGNRAVLSQPVSTPVSIPVLFATQVARAPEAVALSCGGRSLTYREVEEAR
jgi:non-ribosomal peptide synthetase component F